MRPWFERFPERLSEERRALRDLDARVDELERPPTGLVRWAIELPLRALPLPDEHPFSDPLYLIATFPESFPYLRPEVETVGDSILPRHHHPFGKNLCLLGRRTMYWDSDKLLAEHLKEQLPLLAERLAVTDLAELLAIEGEQPEPFTDYYSYMSGVVFVPTAAYEMEADEAGLLHVALPRDLSNGLRVLVRGLAIDGGDRWFETPVNLQMQFPRSAQIAYLRLPAPLAAPTGELGLQLLAELNKPLFLRTVISAPDGDLKLGAVTFPEESTGGRVPAWVFIGEWTPKANGPGKPKQKRKRAGKRPASSTFSVRWGSKEGNWTVLRRMLMWPRILAGGQSEISLYTGGPDPIRVATMPRHGRCNRGILGDEKDLQSLLQAVAAGEVLGEEDDLDAVAAEHSEAGLESDDELYSGEVEDQTVTPSEEERLDATHAETQELGL